MKNKFLIFFLYFSNAFANPQGGDVVSGDVSIISADNNLLVNQLSDKAIVNWQNFSIEKNETTKFMQPSESAVILNRVVTNNPSLIYGNLEANGKIYLINQNGIFIGKDGQISAMSFIASTLNVLDNEFLDGHDINFNGESSCKIQNLGRIKATKEIYLISREVENNGSLDSKTIGIAGAMDVLLYEKGNEDFVVRKNTLGSITNNGVINAAQIELKAASDNIFSLAINQNGVINATGIENKNGRIILASDSGKIEVNGNLKALSLDKGGEINLLAEYVHVKENAIIDVSSEKDGGIVLIGGDYQGKNENIQNAKYVYVENDAFIDASSKIAGNGGKVILWSDEDTSFFGNIDAKGGVISGDGGFVEISSKNNNLRFNGFVNTLANGKTGTLLLDPSDITIGAFGGTSIPSFPTTPPGTYDPVTPSASLDYVNINTALSSTNVVIQTAAGAGGVGTITIQSGSNINWSTPNTLTITADREIIINDAVTIDSTASGSSFTAINFTSGDSKNGDYSGIDLQGIFASPITLQSVDGDIILHGTGGNSDFNHGVKISNSTIQTFPTNVTRGKINITGIGGASLSALSNNNGINIEDSNINTTQGKIVLFGNGGGSAAGQFNVGVFADNTNIKLTSNTKNNGDISISITGTAGDGTTGNRGVNFADDNAVHEISANSGQIVINGIGKGSSDQNDGVLIEDYNIFANNDAGIQITGTGSTDASIFSPGVFIYSVDSILEDFHVVDGNLTITANGGNASPGLEMDNFGGITAGVPIQSLGTGNIVIIATGGANGGPGIEFNRVQAASNEIQSLGTGTIEITATGGSSGSDGIIFHSLAKVSSVSGQITINATGTGVTNYRGLNMLSGSGILSTGSADISIKGIGFDNSFPGIDLNAGAVIGGGSDTGDILLKANFIKLSGAVSGSGNLIIEPINTSDPIDLLNPLSANFRLLSTDLNSINSGFSDVFIGNLSGSHSIVIGTGSESYSFNNFPVTIRGNNIDLNADLTSGNSGADNIALNIGQTSSGILNLYKNVSLTTGNLFINGGTSNNAYHIITTVPQKGTINGTNILDTIYGPNVDTIWNITDLNQGNISGSLSFVNIPSLVGGTQGDRFVLSNNKGLTGLIDGGNS
ncbi:MAG: filamentous hemagglutinin N-terminal domain-containing protein, partial [Parachlamydiales bacterium]